MRLFVCSDLHGFFTPFKKALDNKGFDPANPEHLLIVCGDVLDRGNEPYEMIKYLDGLTNVVLIRGNHEDLLEEMLARGYGERHDHANGTTATVCSIADALGIKAENTYDVCRAVEEFIKPFLSKFVNYYESTNFVFTHGFIPCEKFTRLHRPWYQQGRKFEYNPDWRSSNDTEWEAARWINSIEASYIKEVFEPHKQIVAGHWHCSYGHYARAFKNAVENNTEVLVEEFGPTAIWEPFETEHLIAIDRCTAYTGEVNIVVLEDELLT
jgi:hypothetical protein